MVSRHLDDLDAVLESDSLDDFRQLVFSLQSPPGFCSSGDERNRPAAETTRLTLSRHSRPTRRSFPLHIGRQNHPAPLLHLVGDLFSKVVGRPAKCRAAQIGKLRLELRNGDTDVDFPFSFSMTSAGVRFGRRAKSTDLV